MSPLLQPLSLARDSPFRTHLASSRPERSAKSSNAALDSFETIGNIITSSAEVLVGSAVDFSAVAMAIATEFSSSELVVPFLRAGILCRATEFMVSSNTVTFSV